MADRQVVEVSSTTCVLVKRDDGVWAQGGNHPTLGNTVLVNLCDPKLRATRC